MDARCDCYLEYTRRMLVVQSLFRIDEHRYIGIPTIDNEQFDSESAIGKRVFGLKVIKNDVY